MNLLGNLDQQVEMNMDLNKKNMSADPNDPKAEQRKHDHITLAFESQTNAGYCDDRFHYEPLLSGHPKDGGELKNSFLGFDLKAPLWISSMTGGTDHAQSINQNLARVCGKFGLGMGLGSCRSLLASDEHLDDFRIRKYVGNQPLFANLGIAQLIEIVSTDKVYKIDQLIDKLDADGIIIHINPLQEWFQDSGDIYYENPIEILSKFRDQFKLPIIVKEVGHGYGPRSIEALIDIGVDAIDFASFGGTNFSVIEQSRVMSEDESFDPFVNVGHTANEMTHYLNALIKPSTSIEVIVSGGIKNYLDGYYFVEKCRQNTIYGQASELLRRAIVSYEEVEKYVDSQIKGLQMAYAFLTIKD